MSSNDQSGVVIAWAFEAWDAISSFINGVFAFLDKPATKLELLVVAGLLYGAIKRRR